MANLTTVGAEVTLSVLSPFQNSSISTTLDLSVYERFVSNRRVNELAFASLIAAYSLLIVIGVLGNSLVIYTVAREPAMRNVRNVFVVNLAVSDLLLCLITMPLTLMEILTNTWPMGESLYACKVVGSCQAVSIFVSTFSISAIALDRYQLIVYPTSKMTLQGSTASIILMGIWVMGGGLALPLFIVRTLQKHELPAVMISSPIANAARPFIYYCYEDWPSEGGRSVYSAISLVIQYALPILTVTIAHVCICTKLRIRVKTMQLQRQELYNDVEVGRQTMRQEQLRKTSTLLVAIAIIFAICWLPMNCFNFIVDTWNVFGEDTETMYISYAVCHMIGMSSACANPLLYGWLNDNFRKEFQKIGASMRDRLRCNARSPPNRGGVDQNERAFPSATALTYPRISHLDTTNEMKLPHRGISAIHTSFI